jgi:hypothetical protein
MQVDEIQSRLRNKSAKMLGKWIIRSALCQRRKQKDVRLALSSCAVRYVSLTVLCA